MILILPHEWQNQAPEQNRASTDHLRLYWLKKHNYYQKNKTDFLEDKYQQLEHHLQDKKG
ncbi:hypothetical protein AN662_0223410 [Klebsiella pneumoniae subsp. pneumoniae]|nr:hypothetical protein AN662_0223410 [Klebsiella pneumoniae subsp. pneumoniae]OKB32769.1 hypothetical protein A9F10_22740 [Klebsiella pneumoniae]PMD69548.1 hypothetical protein A8A10_19080 [Klebsiella pneumoniae]CDL21080.1 hypothetical protein [Klebsiella pneumoniae IS53]